MHVNSVGSQQQMLIGLPSQNHPRPSFANTAQLLGMSSEQLRSALQSGATLSSLASSNGVARSDLVASVEKDLKAGVPQGAPTLSSDQLQQIATNIINGTPPTPPAGSGGGLGGNAPFGADGIKPPTGAGGQPPSFANTAQLLRLSSDELAADLESGQTLSSLASAKGISRSDLLETVETDLTQNAPSAGVGATSAPQLNGDQLQQLAGGIVDGALPTPRSWQSDGSGDGGNFVDLYA
jgi:hypothetical protein